MTRREQTSGLESAEAIVKVITAFLQNVFFFTAYARENHCFKFYEKSYAIQERLKLKNPKLTIILT